MISKECLFCGTVLDDDSKNTYICPECEKNATSKTIEND